MYSEPMLYPKLVVRNSVRTNLILMMGDLLSCFFLQFVPVVSDQIREGGKRRKQSLRLLYSRIELYLGAISLIHEPSPVLFRFLLYFFRGNSGSDEIF